MHAMLPLLTASAAAGASAYVVDMCDLSNFTFHAFDGHASGRLLKHTLAGCDGVEMSATDGDGAAASFGSMR
jgi:hypothetical protein